MDDNLSRREAARPPKRAAAAAAEVGANDSLQDGEVTEVHPGREPHAAGKLSPAAGRMERRYSAQLAVHHRHMPIEPLKFLIPRKTKEKRALFQYVSIESREYDDMMTILTSNYIDTGSAGCFTYCKPRLVHSELLEKEFVEKRKEMKADGRTDKELEESYCFLSSVDSVKLPGLCEKGLLVGQSWITVLGNPSKGVYLSKYSDLLQINPLNPGFTGEIIIFKVMKGKVKSIYENMKNLLDPTPRFDSHMSKNASKVTSLSSYRAFELTQQYFYEYTFDELRQRPRQVCPYAVVSFQLKGKDSPLPIKPLAPNRLNSQTAEGSKERAQFTVWTGDLVKGYRVLFQISLRSFCPPFLPHRLPEKLEIGCLMRLDQVTEHLSSDLLSYNLYNSSQEVVKNGYCCCLLEVTDRSRSITSVTRLLLELEMKRVVLVTPLPDSGFLLLISSVQMATPSERGESWKRCLQALFVFPESRDLAISTLRGASSSHNASESSMSVCTAMPRLSQFMPALHHALVKARANPPPELSAGVERQAREYFIGLKDGKVRLYPMGEYDAKLDEEGNLLPAPKHHRVNMDGYLRSYLYSPAFYLLPVGRARQMVEAHCGPEEPQAVEFRNSSGGQSEATGKEASSNARDGQSNTQKMQQLIDLVLTCKRNAENEVRREEEGGGRGVKVQGRKRKLEQETAERTLKFLKASQEPGRHSKTTGIPVPGSLASVIGSVGLKDVDLREDSSELAARLLNLLTDLNQAARGTANQSLCDGQEEAQRASWPFDRLATKLGLPTNCDLDLRKQEELEAVGSVSSSEGFSPSSHSGEMNHHGAAGRGGGGLGRRAGGYEAEEEEEEIPWVLIPITGVCSQRYTQRDRNIPQDPRFQHLTTATSITTTTTPPRMCRTPSPEPSPPHSPSQCPSPDPSPPPSPSLCPSPEPSPPAFPSQCPSPEPSPPPTPFQWPSTQPSLSPSQRPNPPQLGRTPIPSLCQSARPNEHNLLNKDPSGANEEQLAPTAPTAPRESAGMSKDREEKSQGERKKPSSSASIQPPVPAAPERRTPSPAPTEREKADAEQMIHVVACDKEPKGEVKELLGGSWFSPPVSLPPSCLDSVVDKHLDDFSSEMQLLLQEQSVHCSFPQSPHSTSNTETPTPQHTLPHTPISQFSQYVSFYNPCPPVQDYVSSLIDGIDNMLTEFDGGEPSHKPGTSRTNVDAALASRVSDFVSSIRASNAQTGRDEDIFGELTAAGVDASVSQTPALSRGAEVLQPHTILTVADTTANRSPLSSSHVTLSVTTSASGSVYKPANTSVLIPPPHTSPQQSHTLETSGTASIRQTQDPSRTVHCSGVEGGSSAAGTNCEVPGFSGISKPSTDPSHPSEPVSSPPASALSSLISQLQPEVFNSLVKIIKDVKRNSLQFYLHCTEPKDQVHEDVKEYLLKQGNTEQSPLTFLNQENSADRMLVVINNKDIAGHVRKIPGLVSLKRQASVVFWGIDTLDDIRNNSYNELFVSGGCIVSDELVLNPDRITNDRLTALLTLLEQHSSRDSVWRLKVHCKTHKKLKEQSRFRRDAANLLDVLSVYQKRQIVEFLPYHHCDMMNHQSPDLDCLMELQARYTQYRHTVFLTEHHQKFPAHCNSGIIVASFEEILHNFTRVVGYHDIADRQPIIEDMLAPKEHIPPLSSRDQPQHFLQQSDSTPPTLSHLSDQLVPDASCKEGVPHHSDTDLEVLRLAILQLRAERQAQLHQQLDSQAELSIHSLKSFLPNVIPTGSGHTTPPLAQRGPTELVKVSQDRKAVATTLELIHSALKQETSEQERREDRAPTPLEERRRGGGGELGDQRDDTLVRAAGTLEGNQHPSSNQSTAAVMGPSSQTDSTIYGRKKAEQQGKPLFPEAAKHAAASSSTTACPVEGDRSRDTQSGQEQPIGEEGAPPGSGIKAVTRGKVGPEQDRTHASSTTWSQKEVDFPQQCSTSTDGKQDGRKQPGSTGVCAPVSAGIELPSGLSESLPPSCSAKARRKQRQRHPSPAQQGPANSPTSRLQLYNHEGKKYSNCQLSNPIAWKNIAHARLGWTPDFEPFLKPGNRYLELKANSTVVYTGMAPPHGKGPERLACGVTCYNHKEGPWCEVQSQNGDRICILAVPPQHTPPPIARIPPQIRKGQPGQNAKEERVLGESPCQESIMPVLPT